MNKKWIIIILVILILLLLTNPSIDDFSDFMLDEFIKRQNLSSFQEMMVQTLGPSLLENYTERYNLQLISVYKINIPEQNLRYTAIGILTRFIVWESR
ncbi:MAG: hypothetical protein KGY44_02075 [Halanaerobiales bacterium]|nr:hypothetical protein [Halanaerobiales bacterium]